MKHSKSLFHLDLILDTKINDYIQILIKNFLDNTSLEIYVVLSFQGIS